MSCVRNLSLYGWVSVVICGVICAILSSNSVHQVFKLNESLTNFNKVLTVTLNFLTPIITTKRHGESPGMLQMKTVP